jgi:hypothetical protein
MVAKDFNEHMQRCPDKGAETNVHGYNRGVRIKSGVFTGCHFGVKDLLAKMGLSDSLDCRMCGEKDETMEHLLCECHALARQRMNYFGNGYPQPKEFRFVEMMERV